jgi:hypothetical protein
VTSDALEAAACSSTFFRTLFLTKKGTLERASYASLDHFMISTATHGIKIYQTPALQNQQTVKSQKISLSPAAGSSCCPNKSGSARGLAMSTT